MLIRTSLLFLALLAGQQALAQQQQPDMQLLAQAYDRCMATQAVRLTHGDAADQAIFIEAKEACRSLNEQLRLAIGTQLPAAQAAGILQSLDAQSEPNFMALLARIRSDRARRAGE